MFFAVWIALAVNISSKTSYCRVSPGGEHSDSTPCQTIYAAFAFAIAGWVFLTHTLTRTAQEILDRNEERMAEKQANRAHQRVWWLSAIAIRIKMQSLQLSNNKSRVIILKICTSTILAFSIPFSKWLSSYQFSYQSSSIVLHACLFTVCFKLGKFYELGGHIKIGRRHYGNRHEKGYCIRSRHFLQRDLFRIFLCGSSSSSWIIFSTCIWKTSTMPVSCYPPTFLNPSVPISGYSRAQWVLFFTRSIHIWPCSSKYCNLLDIQGLRSGEQVLAAMIIVEKQGNVTDVI